MRRYFESMSYWRLDVIVCFVISAVVTPADPISMLFVFVPLVVIWMIIRFAISRHLSAPTSGPS